MNLSTKPCDKKLKHSGLMTTTNNFDFTQLYQFLNVVTIAFNAQQISKSSRRYSVLKSLTHDYWFRLNQPVSVTILVAETSEPSDFVLRLLRKGAEKGLYLKRGTEYLPSFKLASAMANYFQQGAAPFTLQPNRFLIKTNSRTWRFIADFMSLVGNYCPAENATHSAVIIWLMMLEMTHDDPLTATLLTEKAGFSKSTLSNIVDHLHSVGYIDRQHDPFDERNHILSLTLPDDFRAAVHNLFSRYSSTCD
ncbi:MAG: helix-turn-helix domain-containing protein [Pseudomonadales bacterium]|nr:helix-turn-helix domain-containing protein [Pseudomonadales bacterium]